MVVVGIVVFGVKGVFYEIKEVCELKYELYEWKEERVERCKWWFER